jgi:DNA-binding NtrC family response regulator
MTDQITVLVVEDDALLRMDITTVLQDEGFSVVEVESAPRALASLYGNIGAHCLVTDVDLGEGMDGLELASSVHEEWPDMGIIVVSGKTRTMPVDVPDARFVIKPYDPARIAGMIREMVTTGTDDVAGRAG